MQPIDYETTLQVLMAGCRGGHMPIVALALGVVAQYPSIDLQRTSRHDALYEGARYGNYNIVEMILRRDIHDSSPSDLQEGRPSECSTLLPNLALLPMDINKEDKTISRHCNICMNDCGKASRWRKTLHSEQHSTLAEADDLTHTFITGCASGHQSVLVAVVENDARNLLEPQAYKKGLEIASEKGHDELVCILIAARSKHYGSSLLKKVLFFCLRQWSARRRRSDLIENLETQIPTGCS